MNLKNKLVLITGGAKGIGLATAQRILNEGGKVILWDFNEDDLNKTVHNFKEVNNIPMSTTFVFMGMLAGRELGIWLSIGYGKLTYTDRHKKAIFPMLYMDFLRLMLGLMISVSLAYGIQWYSNL